MPTEPDDADWAHNFCQDVLMPREIGKCDYTYPDGSYCGRSRDTHGHGEPPDAVKEAKPDGAEEAALQEAARQLVKKMIMVRRSEEGMAEAEALARQALRDFRERGVEKGVSGVLMIRCSKHYGVPQLNHSEHSGGECGACARAEMENRLRHLLWVGHGHQGLYRDDGEMQCSECPLDFKRDPLDLIDHRLSENAASRLAGSMKWHEDDRREAQLAILKEAARLIDSAEKGCVLHGSFRAGLAHSQKLVRGLIAELSGTEATR